VLELVEWRENSLKIYIGAVVGRQRLGKTREQGVTKAFCTYH
jgi:hypothetical protein